jgi:hypothetical protein
VCNNNNSNSTNDYYKDKPLTYSSQTIIMSQPEWMKVYNQMGLKGQVVTSVDDKGSVVQTAPPEDSDAANAPSRFEKFEHKPKERANSTTPPWLANLKKNQQKTPIVEDTTAEEDAAALFAAAALGPPVVAKAPVVDDEEDAAALFHSSANIPAVVHDSDDLTAEEEDMSARYRKMLQMGTLGGIHELPGFARHPSPSHTFYIIYIYSRHARGSRESENASRRNSPARSGCRFRTSTRTGSCPRTVQYGSWSTRCPSTRTRGGWS